MKGIIILVWTILCIWAAAYVAHLFPEPAWWALPLLSTALCAWGAGVLSIIMFRDD